MMHALMSSHRATTTCMTNDGLSLDDESATRNNFLPKITQRLLQASFISNLGSFQLWTSGSPPPNSPLSRACSRRATCIVPLAGATWKQCRRKWRRTPTPLDVAAYQGVGRASALCLECPVHWSRTFRRLSAFPNPVSEIVAACTGRRMRQMKKSAQPMMRARSPRSSRSIPPFSAVPATVCPVAVSTPQTTTVGHVDTGVTTATILRWAG